MLGIVSLCIHAIPFLACSLNPLGYDTGFYRRYLIQPFSSFPDAPVPGLGSDAWGPRILLDLLRLLHLQADVILYGSYLLLCALLPILLFAYLRRPFGQRCALLAGLFVILSPVGYQAYWFMLYKNIFALDLMIIAFIALESRRTKLAAIFEIALSLSHATSAIVYMLTLVPLIVFSPGRRREFGLHLALTASAFTLVNMPLVRDASVALPTALFIEWPQYLSLSLPFLVLLALGIERRALSVPPIPATLVAFTGASLLYTLMHLPFYERIFVYLDVGLASLSAYAAFSVIRRIPKAGSNGSIYAQSAVICIAFGLLFGNLFSQIHTLQPLMSESAIARISAVGSIVPSDALILTSANEAPWYEGWTAAHIAAPGLLHDTHDLAQWQALWDATSSAYRIRFLSSFGEPLYVSTLDSYQELVGAVPPCLQKISSDLFHDACDEAVN